MKKKTKNHVNRVVIVVLVALGFGTYFLALFSGFRDLASQPVVESVPETQPQQTETSGLITFSINPVMTDKVQTNNNDRMSVPVSANQ